MSNKEITIENVISTLTHFEFKPTNQAQTLALKIDFGTCFKRIDGSHVVVGLEAIIGDKEDSPVFCQVRYQGQLAMENYEEDADDKKYLEETACATFYPYIRSTVARLFSDAGLPPFQMPILPIANLLKEQKP